MIRGKDYRSMWVIESIIKNVSFGILSLNLSEDTLLCQQIVRIMIIMFTEEVQTI